MTRPWVRPTARVVVLDPAQRVLLLGARLTDPDVPPGDVLFWYTPGGGVEHGESLRRTADRRPDLLAALGADALSDDDRAVLDGG